MRVWQEIEWPRPCGACVITRARLLEMGFFDEPRADYLLCIIPLNDDVEDDVLPMWVMLPEQLREIVRMAAPEKLEIKSAAGEDVAALRRYCLAAGVH